MPNTTIANLHAAEYKIFKIRCLTNILEREIFNLLEQYDTIPIDKIEELYFLTESIQEAIT